MKLRLASQIALLSLITLSFLFNAFPTSAQNRITESQLLTILSSIDKAAKNKNAEAIAVHMAPDIAFKVKLQGFGNDQTIIFDRAKFVAFTKQGMSKEVKYECDRQDISITIRKDGEVAMVTDSLYETITLRGGQTLSTVTSEIFIFKLYDGKIAMTEFNGTMRLIQN